MGLFHKIFVTKLNCCRSRDEIDEKLGEGEEIRKNQKRQRPTSEAPSTTLKYVIVKCVLCFVLYVFF